MPQKSDTHDHLHAAALRIAKFHFILVGLYIAQTIVFHASKVITPDVVMWRWYAGAGLLAVTALVWFIARNHRLPETAYRWAIALIILADLAFAAFNVYIQRGYASKSVVLFLIPIIVAATLMNRAALFMTALFAVAVYSTTVITYFTVNFNEGYMSEMYAEIGLYSGIFLLTAGLLWTTTHRHR